MKRRKAMHYLRRMIDNPAIAYMLTHFEADTDLRRNCVRIYRKYWRYMKSDTIILPYLGDDVPIEDNTVNIIWFANLRTRCPSVTVLKNVKPVACNHLANLVENHEGNSVEFGFDTSVIDNEKVGPVADMLRTWIESIRESDDTDIKEE